MKQGICGLLAGLLLLTLADSPAQPPERAGARDARFHVYLLLGQSNMAGFEKAADGDRMADPRILALGFDDCPAAGRTEGAWSVSVPPLHECWNGALGPGDVFARAMLETLPEGDRIGLVPSALSGEPVETFMKGLPDSRYDWIVSRAQAALDAGGVIEAILFHQGESNCGQSDWPEKVAAFIGDLRDELGIGDDAPFLAGELLHSGNCERHNALVGRLPDLLPNAHVVTAEGLLMAQGDPWSVHFSRDALIELGRRYAQALIELQSP